MFCSVLNELVELVIKLRLVPFAILYTFMVMQITLLLSFSFCRNAVALKASFFRIVCSELRILIV